VSQGNCPYTSSNLVIYVATKPFLGNVPYWSLNVTLPGSTETVYSVYFPTEKEMGISVLIADWRVA